MKHFTTGNCLKIVWYLFENFPKSQYLIEENFLFECSALIAAVQLQGYANADKSLLACL